MLVFASSISSWFTDRQWWEIAAIALVMNLGIVANSVFVWRLAAHRRGVSGPSRPVSGRDRALTATTTIVNAAALVPAWWLWTEGTIELASIDPLRIIIEVTYLVLAVDLVMYVVHRIFHLDPLYRWFHQVHHTDDAPTNELTLFVMHPLEAAGFGVLVLALLTMWSVSVVGIAIFFTINLIAGTVAHVPTSGSPSRWDRLFGGSPLHQGHHEAPNTGYGFFTTTWDRLFGSLPPRF